MHEQVDTSQWQMLGVLFDQAIDMDAAQQAEFLRTIARDDAELAQALRSLLESDARHQARTREQHERVLQGSLAAIEALGPAVGDRVGPYILRERIGHGGMGVVFRAERADGQGRQEVALKIVKGSLLDAHGRERFLRECAIVAGFHHPYIARMLDVGESADGSPYLAMELIRGLPITGYCDARKLNTRRRVVLFLRVCEAVRHAHANLVLHRDLKPGNVLVGDDGLPKLIDFGIAKPLTIAADSEYQQTTTTHRFFSPSNAAPEQLGGGRVGVACDVYQLGTLLHELLCGAAVFDARGLTPGQLEERIREDAPEAPSARAERASVATAHARGATTPASLARKLRGDLDAIVALALRKSPEERYNSVERLADDLRHYLDRRPVAARRGQRWYSTRRFLQRQAVAVAASTAVFVVVFSLVTALWVQSQQIARIRDPSPRATAIVADSHPSGSHGEPYGPDHVDRDLDLAVHQGLIRAATAADLQAWNDAQTHLRGSGNGVPPIVPSSALQRTYVVLKPMRLPDGLHGAKAASFFVPKGVAVPTGNRSDSPVRDFNTMTCFGPVSECRL